MCIYYCHHPLPRSSTISSHLDSYKNFLSHYPLPCLPSHSAVHNSWSGSLKSWQIMILLWSALCWSVLSWGFSPHSERDLISCCSLPFPQDTPAKLVLTVSQMSCMPCHPTALVHAVPFAVSISLHSLPHFCLNVTLQMTFLMTLPEVTSLLSDTNTLLCFSLEHQLLPDIWREYKHLEN